MGLERQIVIQPPNGSQDWSGSPGGLAIMVKGERPAGPDVQQCPSCGSTAVMSLAVEGGKVSVVCTRCGRRWTIDDRRSPRGFAHDGPDRRKGPVPG